MSHRQGPRASVTLMPLCGSHTAATPLLPGHSPLVSGPQGVPSVLFLAYLALASIEYLGLSADIPLLKTLRASTLLSYGLALIAMCSADTRRLFREREPRLFVAFIVLTCLSVTFAYVQTRAVESIRPLIDYLVFLIVTVHVLDRPGRLDKLLLLMVLVVTVLVLRNLDVLGQAERVGDFRASYFMGDGNDFAWGLVLIAPLALILTLGDRSALTRLVGAVGFGLCLFGIVSTQSRGGTLGLAVSLLYGWLFITRYKMPVVVGAIVLAVGAAAMAPEGYFARMRTVATYDEDNSARTRLQAWAAATKMAVDHPLGVGAGNFNSVYGRFYIPDDEHNQMTYGARRWVSVHSVYFKVLAEYGFLGLGLFGWLLISVLRRNSSVRRTLQAAAQPTPLDSRVPGLLNMSLVGAMTCGIFLGGFEYPHFSWLAALALVVQRLAVPEMAVAASAVERLEPPSIRRRDAVSGVRLQDPPAHGNVRHAPLPVGHRAVR